MNCRIFSSKVIIFFRKNANLVLLGYFCEWIKKSNTSINTLNSKFSRGFLGIMSSWWKGAFLTMGQN